MPCSQLVWKGIKYQQAKEQHKEQSQLPITPTIMKKLKDAWLSNPSLDIMLWAAVSLCFLEKESTVPSDKAFNQRAHLTLSDITVDSFKSPKMLKIKIKASKLVLFGKQPPGNGPLFKFVDGRPLTRSLFMDQG